MTFAWQELDGLDAYRMTEIPRGQDAGETETTQRQPGDPGRMQRLAALIAAYHAAVGSRIGATGALAIGWVRHRAGGPDHLVGKERLDQRLAEQVGLAGRGRPPAGPVDQVEVVERAQRAAGEGRGERGQAGQVLPGCGRARQKRRRYSPAPGMPSRGPRLGPGSAARPPRSPRHRGRRWPRSEERRVGKEC